MDARLTQNELHSLITNDDDLRFVSDGDQIIFIPDKTYWRGYLQEHFPAHVNLLEQRTIHSSYFGNGRGYETKDGVMLVAEHLHIPETLAAQDLLGVVCNAFASFGDSPDETVEHIVPINHSIMRQPTIRNDAEYVLRDVVVRKAARKHGFKGKYQQVFNAHIPANKHTLYQLNDVFTEYYSVINSQEFRGVVKEQRLETAYSLNRALDKAMTF